MPSQTDAIAYTLCLKGTEASTGFFACVPEPELNLEQALAYLDLHPLDTFMFRHALGLLSQLSFEQMQLLVARDGSGTAVRQALMLEACLSASHLSQIGAAVDSEALKQSAPWSPSITLRAMSRPDYEIHKNWNHLLAANLSRHQLLPPPDQAPWPWPYTAEAVADPGGVYITQVLSSLPADRPTPVSRPSSAETAAIALEKLGALGILEEGEMRHESSLSPYGLLRKWRLGIEVVSGRHRLSLSGMQTAYGRGLCLDDARASYAMEIVERCSSFANVGSGCLLNYEQGHPIHHGAFSALQKGAIPPIDPNDYGVDVPYRDEPLHWIQGMRRTRAGDEAVLVPVQSIFLFSNLDEIDLYAGHGSTGLASGNTMAEARLSALMELVERDGEATHPFHYAMCFQVGTRDPKVAALLEDYRGRGIQFQFQDISPPYGIPCCKCFVTDMDGRIAKGTAASLNGRRAVLSALTETPYPYPFGPPSGPGLLQLPQLALEQLPDYSANDAQQDLALVEALLMANGLSPIYVDLTRRDLGLPVVRALLPGFALTADLEGRASVHPRLFANYLKIFSGAG
jgi:ribosomal protein S12 methylthiotransferase accessory factor